MQVHRSSTEKRIKNNINEFVIYQTQILYLFQYWHGIFFVLFSDDPVEIRRSFFIWKEQWAPITLVLSFLVGSNYIY